MFAQKVFSGIFEVRIQLFRIFGNSFVETFVFHIFPEIANSDRAGPVLITFDKGDFGFDQF